MKPILLACACALLMSAAIAAMISAAAFFAPHIIPPDQTPKRSCVVRT